MQSVNNELFDNGFGGLPINPAYDGGIYEAYPPLNPGGGGGGGGSIYREYDTLDRQNLADGGMGRERMEFQ